MDLPSGRSEAPLRVDVPLGDRSYSIFVGEGLLSDSAFLAQHIRATHVLIVTNDVVAPLYLEPLRAALTRSAPSKSSLSNDPLGSDRPGKSDPGGDSQHDARSSRKVSAAVLPDGEANKTLDTLSTIFDALVEARLNRDAAVIALGGGVVGDMAGFAAAAYQRGIDYIQIPTTLLAQVDSSVGGKTGVNHPGGKNLIGAFHQPRCVIADTGTLRTLPDREYKAGLAEVIKYGLIRDAVFFEWLERHAADLMSRDATAVAYAVQRSCEIKAEVVGLDEHELGVRAILNLGHTFGHAIETASGYGTWLHGEAIAVGMLLATDMSVRLGWLPAAVHERATRLMSAVGLPSEPPRIGAATALKLMGMDKKVLGGKLRLVLMTALGTAVISSDYPPQVLDDVLRQAFG